MNKQRGVFLTPAIQWHEGMLLSPQHLQQNDLRFEQLLYHHLNLLSPYHWGIHYLKIDPIVFPEGLVRILGLQAVMPDGLAVDYTANAMDTMPLEIDLKPFKPTNSKEVITIYLTVAESIPGVSSVVGEWTRYLSVEGEGQKISILMTIRLRFHD